MLRKQGRASFDVEQVRAILQRKYARGTLDEGQSVLDLNDYLNVRF